MAQLYDRRKRNRHILYPLIEKEEKENKKVVHEKDITCHKKPVSSRFTPLHIQLALEGTQGTYATCITVHVFHGFTHRESVRSVVSV